MPSSLSEVRVSLVRLAATEPFIYVARERATVRPSVRSGDEGLSTYRRETGNTAPWLWLAAININLLITSAIGRYSPDLAWVVISHYKRESTFSDHAALFDFGSIHIHVVRITIEKSNVYVQKLWYFLFVWIYQMCHADQKYKLTRTCTAIVLATIKNISLERNDKIPRILEKYTAMWYLQKITVIEIY